MLREGLSFDRLENNRLRLRHFTLLRPALRDLRLDTADQVARPLWRRVGPARQVVHHRPQHISSVKQQSNKVRVERDVFIAHKPDQVFRRMGAGLDRRKPKNPRIALEGVNRPEQRGDMLRLLRVLLEG